MAVIVEKEFITPDIFLLTVGGVAGGDPGQFYMLLAASSPPGRLMRPISLFDASPGTARFLIQIKGRGTHELSRTEPGEDIAAMGPLGCGFDLRDERSFFVGGGMGAAPVRFAAARFTRIHPGREAQVYLGFSSSDFASALFDGICARLTVDVGGRIGDLVEPTAADVFACGPEAMLESLAQSRRGLGRLSVSLERRMGCGVGACYSCSVKTVSGMRRVCCEGPVFDAGEVFA